MKTSRQRKSLLKKILPWAISGVLVIAAVVGIAFMNQSFRVGAAPNATEAGGILVDGTSALEGPLTEVDTGAEAPDPTPTTGATDAPHMVVYVDPACPHCRDFEASYGEQLAELASNGDITLEYRVVGILSNYSTQAAKGLACVAEQQPSAYTAYLTDTLNAAEQLPGNDQLAAMAAVYGVDIDDCLNSRKYNPFVNYTTEQAREVITGTPSIWVDGENWTSTSGSFTDWLEARL